MHTIRENLIEAIRAVEAHPEPMLDLMNFRLQTECGTLYCAAGLLTTVPFFQEQGLKLLLGGGDRVVLDTDTERMTHTTWPCHLFGARFTTLFGQRGDSQWDIELTEDIYEEDALVHKFPSDKQLALARLRKQLEICEPR